MNWSSLLSLPESQLVRFSQIWPSAIYRALGTLTTLPSVTRSTRYKYQTLGTKTVSRVFFLSALGTVFSIRETTDTSPSKPRVTGIWTERLIYWVVFLLALGGVLRCLRVRVRSRRSIGYNIDYDEYHRQNLKNIWAEWGRIYGLLVWGLSFFFSPFPLQSKAESERKTIVSNLNLNACNTLVSNRNESFVSKNKITTEEDD